MIFPALLQYSDFGFLILRAAVAIIFLYHAWPKLKNPKGVAQAMGAPSVMPLVLGLVETLSALALLTGFYFQLGALALAVVMIGALYLKTTKWHLGFSAMNATGWEFDLVLLAGNLLLLTNGPGGLTLF